MKSEKKTYVDRASGVEVTQLTDHKGHSHHFYFTNPGWYAQGRKLLFASDRNNRTNLFGVDLETGETGCSRSVPNRKNETMGGETRL